jgi:pre-mRNA-splicing factor SYF1
MEGMSLPILEDDIPYEQEIIKTPDEFGPWMRYVEFKAERPVAERIFVLERACRALGRSYKLWKMYLDLQVSYLKNLDQGNRRFLLEAAKVNHLYERALILLHKMPRLWIDYLQLLLQQPQLVTHTRRTFNKALQALPTAQHDRIWPLYLEFVQHVNPRTASSIWLRYIEFNTAEIETCVENLIDLGQYQQAADLLIKMVDDAKFISFKGRSRYQLWEDLAELLVHHGSDIQGIDVERVIGSGIEKFTDQQGKLCVQLATCWVNMGQFEKARNSFEAGLERAITIRDFSQIFDSYAEFEESIIAKLMNKGHDENEMDRHMEIFEQLMDRRPFIVNDVLLRQDPNNVVEWEKRVGLWGNNQQEVVNTYEKAIETIHPKKANGSLSQLWSNYAKFYENGRDLATARIIFDKATKVPFKSVNELTEVWIEWAEMELRIGDFDNAVRVMETATRGPKISKVDYFDDSRSPQERLHKSMKLWSFYVDLVESVGTLDQIKPLYDRIFELKIGTTLTIVNYANLLEENNYFEEAFKVYERGIELFSYPIAFEIWNIYLNKAVKRNLGIERLRDLCEQAIENCPAKFCKPLYLLYGKLEEDRGLIKNAIKIYDRATKTVDEKDKLETYQYYIARVAENFGLPGTRPIFQDAIDNLNDRDANIISQEFIEVEEKLGEIDRARALLGFSSQFNDLRTAPEFWAKWDKFEVKYGSEDTYKEMLRIKRSVQAQFNTDLRYVAIEASKGIAISTNESNAMSRMEKLNNAPIGFVAGTTETPSVEKIEATGNPDEIELEM